MSDADDGIMKMFRDPDAGFGAFLILVVMVVAAVIARVLG